MDEVAKPYSELSDRWLEQLACVFSYFSPPFGRINRQRHAWEYLVGLLSSVTERLRQETVEQLGNTVTEANWQTLSAGDGSKGPRGTTGFVCPCCRGRCQGSVG